MKILNFGSLNLDHIYRVEHFTGAKETQITEAPITIPGGKGLNESIALARAGAEVWQAGMIGEDGQMLLDTLQKEGVHTEFVRIIPEKTGHAIVQVDIMGQNAVLQYGGSNNCITEEFIDEVLEAFGEGDVILLQNQISCLPQLIDKAYDKGMQIILKPSPYTDSLLKCDLSKVSMFLVNRTEGRSLTTFVQPGDMMIEFRTRYPHANILLTLAENGAFFVDKESSLYQPAIKMKENDTTGAGDVFIGFFLSSYLDGAPIQAAMERAAAASAISITRTGSASSTPTKEEVDELLKQIKKSK